MQQEAIRIGDVATAAGVSVRSLRYYEEQGLLDPGRTPGGQRIYSADAVDRVRLLQRLYAAGLSSSTIAELLPCVDRPSAQVTAGSLAVLEREHARLTAQIKEISLAREQLALLLGAVRLHHRPAGPDAFTEGSARPTVRLDSDA